MKIVADKHIPFIKDYFTNNNELLLKAGRTIAHEDVKDADILLVRSITPVSEKLLAHSSIKFVGSVTAGCDHVDTKWLQDRGIEFAFASGFNAPPVADYVISNIAALQRRQLLPISGKIAIIGVGHVGKLVAERLKCLPYEIQYCDPIRAANEKDFTSITLDQIRDVDLITLHVPLTKEGEHPTYHFINKEFLQRQKPGCILLNASRGSVLDSNQLLLHGTHLQWCFDVWEHEPAINQAILARATLASPHIAGYSVQSKLRGIDMIYRAACENQWIQPNTTSPISMPEQALSFAGSFHHWQDIVLGVFNPLVMTLMMKTKLLTPDFDPHAFDEMRNQFNYRHEFCYTRLTDILLKDEDQRVLKSFGFKLGNVA